MHSKSRGSIRTDSILPIHKNIQASYRFTLSQAPPPLPQVNNCQGSCTSLRGICRHQIQIAQRLHWTEIIMGTPIGQGGHNMTTNKLPKTVQGGTKTAENVSNGPPGPALGDTIISTATAEAHLGFNRLSTLRPIVNHGRVSNRQRFKDALFHYEFPDIVKSWSSPHSIKSHFSIWLIRHGIINGDIHADVLHL